MNVLNSKRLRLLCSFSVLISVAIMNSCSDNTTSVDEPQDLMSNQAYIYFDSSRQIIRGFGGVNMPGWIDDLTPDQVNKAFGTGQGQIGMTILRIRVPFD